MFIIVLLKRKESICVFGGVSVSTMTIKVLHSLNWCGEDTIYDYILAYALWYPIIMLVAVATLKITKDITVFLYATLMFNGFYWLLFLIAVVVESPRPLEVSECDTTYALPDANVVTTVSWTLFLIVNWTTWRRLTWGQIFNFFSILLALAAYLTAIMRGQYLTWIQFAANMGIAIFLAFSLWLYDFMVGAECIDQVKKTEEAQQMGFVDAFHNKDSMNPAGVRRYATHRVAP